MPTPRIGVVAILAALGLSASACRDARALESFTLNEHDKRSPRLGLLRRGASIRRTRVTGLDECIWIIREDRREHAAITVYAVSTPSWSQSF